MSASKYKRGKAPVTGAFPLRWSCLVVEHSARRLAVGVWASARSAPGGRHVVPEDQVVHQFVSCRPNDLFTLLTHLHYLLSRPGLAAPADIEVKSALSS